MASGRAGPGEQTLRSSARAAALLAAGCGDKDGGDTAATADDTADDTGGADDTSDDTGVSDDADGDGYPDLFAGAPRPA